MKDNGGETLPSRPASLDEARWRAILSSARDAIICIDAEGIVALFNPSAERMFGHDAAEVVGRDVAMLMPAPYAAEHSGYIRAYRQTGVAKAIGVVRDVEAQRRDGTIFPIELSLSEVADADGTTYTAIIRDVSERRRTEEELRDLEHDRRQSDRLADIGAITAKVVHDLGNPLAALTMQAQLILRRAARNDFSPADLVRRPVEQMLETLGRLEILVRDFTEFSRERRMRLEPTLLSSYLLEVCDLWDAYASEQNVRLRTDVDDDVPSVLIDPEMFRRVLDNLIKNAIDAMATRSGTVTLGATRRGEGTFRISVADEGDGIPQDIDAFRLFESSKPDGTGIGLAIAKQIVEAHGGEIHYAAQPGGGTIFHLDLPSGDSRAILA